MRKFHRTGKSQKGSSVAPYKLRPAVTSIFCISQNLPELWLYRSTTSTPIATRMPSVPSTLFGQWVTVLRCASNRR